MLDSEQKQQHRYVPQASKRFLTPIQPRGTYQGEDVAEDTILFSSRVMYKGQAALQFM